MQHCEDCSNFQHKGGNEGICGAYLINIPDGAAYPGALFGGAPCAYYTPENAVLSIEQQRLAVEGLNEIRQAGMAMSLALQEASNQLLRAREGLLKTLEALGAAD